MCLLVPRTGTTIPHCFEHLQIIVACTISLDNWKNLESSSGWSIDRIFGCRSRVSCDTPFFSTSSTTSRSRRVNLSSCFFSNTNIDASYNTSAIWLHHCVPCIALGFDLDTSLHMCEWHIPVFSFYWKIRSFTNLIDKLCIQNLILWPFANTEKLCSQKHVTNEPPI